MRVTEHLNVNVSRVKHFQIVSHIIAPEHFKRRRRKKKTQIV